jgi:hypothetical protein
MKQIPKLCIDCKHFRIEKALENRKDLGHCVRNAKVSLVTGEIESINESPFCSVERMNDSKCSSRGDYFEANPNSGKYWGDSVLKQAGIESYSIKEGVGL